MYEVKVCSKDQLPVELQDGVYDDYRMTLLIVHDGEMIACHTDGESRRTTAFIEMVPG